MEEFGVSENELALEANVPLVAADISQRIEALDTIDLDQLTALRMEIKDALATVRDEEKTLKRCAEAIEEKVRFRMESLGLATASTEFSRIVLKEDSYPSVSDWGQLVRFIKENDAWQLFQKRLSASAFNELCDIIGSVPPGVEIFTKTTAKFTDIRNRE